MLIDALRRSKRHIEFEIFAGQKTNTLNYNYDDSQISLMLKDKKVRKDYLRFIEKTGLHIDQNDKFYKQISRIAHLLIY